MGGAALAPLHPDEGLDLSVHLEFHYGLDQWPVGTTSVRMGAAKICVGATAVCLSLLSSLLVPIIPLTSGVLEFFPDLTADGCHRSLSHKLCPTPMSPESSGTTAVDSTLLPGLPLSNFVALAAGCSSWIVVGADPEVILDLSLHIQLTGIPVVSACFQFIARICLLHCSFVPNLGLSHLCLL